MNDEQKMNHARELFLKGVEQMDLGQHAKAKSFFEESLKCAPDRLSTLMNLSYVHSELGNIDEAISIYEFISEKQPDDKNLMKNFASLHLKARHFHEAIVLLNKCIAMDPEYVDALTELVIAYEGLNELNTALKFCNKLIEIRSDNSEFYYKKSNILYKLKLNPEAEINIKKAITFDQKNPNYFVLLALILTESHQSNDAIEAYQSALHIDADNFLALINLSNLLCQCERFVEALELIDKSIQINPNSEVAYLNRGNLKKNLSNLPSAFEDYDQSIMLNPNFSEAYLAKGILLKELKRPHEAINNFEKALELNPRHADALINSGHIFLEMKKFHDALGAYNKAIELEPRSAEAYCGIAIAQFELKNVNTALKNCDMAISLNPKYADAFRFRGNILIELNRFDEAILSYDEALSYKPDSFEVYINRGVVLKELNRIEDALSSYKTALALKPSSAEAYNNRGNLLSDIDRFDEALSDYDAAIKFKANYIEAHVNRGNVLKNLNRLDEAIQSYSKAIELMPNDSEAYFNMSLVQLLSGDFTTGWNNYEWRKKIKEPLGAATFPKPLLSSLDSVSGKTILVHHEQGLGDTIQFCRYLSVLADRGASVLFKPQASLAYLLASLDERITIINGLKDIHFDFHLPLMSMPWLFKTDLIGIPNKIPYLKSDPSKIENWKKRIGADGFKVGICWQGSTNKIDRGRSFAIHMFERISRLPHVRLISLHKGAGEEQLKDVSDRFSVENLGEDFDAGEQAFVDTAAVMQCLDLIITSDTAIAHLAGALGRPTWVALKFVPDWRWMTDRTDSPWYPSMKLFRQRISHDWRTVFDEIEIELTKLLSYQP